MAWCPNCKNEYREGITVCPDCEVELVDEEPVDEAEVPGELLPVKIMKIVDDDAAEKIVKYLRYNGIKSYALVDDVTDDEPADTEKSYAEAAELSGDRSSDKTVALVVADIEKDATMELFRGLIEGEEVDLDRLYELVPDIEDQFDELEKEEASMEFEELRSEASTVYVKKKDKYADLRFSGFSFIGFGIIGVIIIVLNLMHVINLFNTYSLIVMSAVFVVFFIIGFATLRRATLVKDSVAVEDEFTEELNQWIEENLGDEVIDEWYDESREDQENYFDIQDKMIRMMHEQFPNIHPSYIEELAEERYNSYLERSAYESPDDIPLPEESEEDMSETESEDTYTDDDTSVTKDAEEIKDEQI
ncbi:MAG TPA: hypothetical protein DCP06_01865 [Lachnospiraceae bacterium]|nr:hypothetical protein [Lachnospiraceae bacterium]